MMVSSGALKKGALFVLAAAVVSTGIVAYRSSTSGVPVFGAKKSVVTKETLAQAFGDSNTFFKFPSEVEIPLGEGPALKDPDDKGDKLKAIVQYSFDAKLQETMEATFKSYAPDYGALVAMDAATGRVLAMVSYSRDPAMKDNLALRATFPSASVFKVVTAAAVIQERNFNPNTLIQFNGANHTLYKNNILKTSHRWSRYVSLKTAFAQSVNTVFGRIGAYNVGPEKLAVYANRFGFNRKIAGDLPLQQGNAPIPAGADAWDLAQTASGYTRDNTMSPLQGALIAAAIANDGIMMEPYVVQSVHTTEGTPIYAAEPRVSNVAIEPSTAAEVRSLMNETIARGTSRKSFRGFFKGPYRDLNVGGKTGSLTGMDPPGKYDWFVGFAGNGSQRIAIAALTIHQKLWRVKSSYLARKTIETYFQGNKKAVERNIADNSR